MANLFFSSVRPRSLTFYSFTVPNPKPKWKPRLSSGSLPFKPRPKLFPSFSASGGGELGIVSTSECADGSVVFRFGDVDEIEEERVKIGSAALVDEECEEIEVIDEEIDSVTEGLVESSSLAMEGIGFVDESVSVDESGDGLELSETMLEEMVNLTENFVEKEINSVTEGLVESSSLVMGMIDLVEESVSVGEAVEGESGGGLGLSETMLEERASLTEDFVDKEIDSVAESSSLAMEMIDLVEESVSVDETVEGESGGGLELNEPMLEEMVSLTEDFVDKEIDGVTESSSLVTGMIDLVEDSVSVEEAVEGESGGGLELSETMLQEKVDLTEGVVNKDMDSGSEEVGGEIHGGFELSEMVLDDKSLHLEDGYVDEDSVSGDDDEVEGEIDGGWKRTETLLDESEGLEKGFVGKDSDEVEGETDCGLELSETLSNDTVGLEKVYGARDSVNSTDEVEGEADHGLELSEVLLEDIVRVEEGSVETGGVVGGDVVEGESDRLMDLSEALPEASVDIEEGHVESIGSGSDVVEGEIDSSSELSDVVEGESDRLMDLSEALPEASVDIEEGHVENIGSGSDVVEGESDSSSELSEALQEASVDIEEFLAKDIVTGSVSDVVEADSDHALDLSETLPKASVDIEEVHVENSGSGSDVVEGESDSDHALDLSTTLMEANADLEEANVENIGRGSDVKEGESDRALDLSEPLPEASVAIEEGYVENSGSESNIAKHDCDDVLETGTLQNSIQLEEVPNGEAAELADNGVSTSALPSSLGTVNQEVKGDEFVTQLASLEPQGESNVQEMYTSIERIKENANVEAPHHSAVAVNINVDTEVNNVSGELTDDSSLIEVMPVLDALEAEPILDEETSYEPVETEQTTSLEMLDVSALSSNWVETITEDDAKNTNLAEEPVHNPIELQPTSLIREDASRAELFLSSGASLFPVASKALTGREDAYFVASQNWLGVADGVSEWSLQGVNVGSYARELMENCEKIVLDSDRVPITNPIEVLNRSVSDTKSHGSSTALVAFFNGWALCVANIGDSGFIIVRNDTVFKRSSPMVHGINFPIHIERGDDPSELVEEYDIDLSEDDIIVVATDGLFDNLYEEEIASIASKSAQAGLEPQDIAELLAARALEVGASATGMSPFADVAQAAGYAGRTGGKLDDVAVIVSLVQKRSNPQ